MKVEYLNPFLNAAINVLKQVLELDDIKRGELELRSDAFTRSLGVAVVIGITGQLQGRVMFDMNRTTSVKIASVMNGEELLGFNNLVRSTIAELTNMITGNAISQLNDAGYQFDITPPTVFSGKEIDVSESVAKKILIVPLKTKYGEIHINLALAER